VENWLWKRLLTCHGTDRRMNEWSLVYLCWNVLFVVRGVLKTRILLFWYQLIKTAQWDDLYSTVCRVGKSRSALYGADRFFFADCVFIHVTCGRDNTQQIKMIPKIWRRTSHWTETVVSCMWGQVLLVVKTCCLLMRYLGGTSCEYRAIHGVFRFRFSVSISISG
jgi:hypothetical protein